MARINKTELYEDLYTQAIEKGFSKVDAAEHAMSMVLGDMDTIVTAIIEKDKEVEHGTRKP